MNANLFALIALVVLAQAVPQERKAQLDVVNAFPEVSKDFVTGCTRLASGALRCDSAGLVLDMDSSGKLSGVSVQRVRGVSTEKECVAAMASARPLAKMGKSWKDGKVAPVSTTFFVEGDLVLAATWADNKTMTKSCSLKICNPATDNLAPYCINLKERMNSLP